MKAQTLILILFVTIQLCACIEVRDNKKTEEAPPMVAAQRFADLVVDEPMYIYDGQILNEKDLVQAQKDQAEKKEAPQKHDFEFQFEQLTITERGILYTLGNNVRLHAEDLKITGLIATYPENQTAPQNQDGRSGGHLFVDAGMGEGILNIIMRGEKGGKGLEGEKPDSSMKGSPGQTGKDGDYFGTNGICSSRATGGGIGGKGIKGHLGKNGKSGGDSGTLEVKIKNDVGITYSIQRKPGLSGEGGDGGAGGEGGDNGAPGRASFDCGGWRLAPDSNQGPGGDVGDKGQPGAAGVLQTVCINRNGTMNCYE